MQQAEKKIVGRDFVVDYQGDSAPEAVTEPEPAADAKVGLLVCICVYACRWRSQQSRSQQQMQR